MKDISTGLVEVFGMNRINPLEERNIFERKSGSAITTSERNKDCGCKDAYPPIMSIYNCVQNGEREQACSFPFPVRGSLSDMKVSNVLTAHSNMGGMATLSTVRSVVPAVLPCNPLFVFVLQCLVRSCMDHGAESHRVRSAVSVESKYGQWRPSHARAWDTSLFHSRIGKQQAIVVVFVDDISLVSFMTTRSVHALEDHVA